MAYEKIYKDVVVNNLERKLRYFKDLIEDTEKSLKAHEEESRELSDKWIHTMDKSEEIRLEIKKQGATSSIFYLNGILQGYKEAYREFEIITKAFKDCEVF